MKANFYLGFAILSAMSGADPTTTTSAATSCASASLLPTHPSGLHCGDFGQLNSPSPLSDATTLGSLEECAGLCASDPDCHSIGFSNDTSACQLYSRRLLGQNYTNRADDMGTTFYARGCFACPSTMESSSTQPEVSTSYAPTTSIASTSNITSTASSTSTSASDHSESTSDLVSASVTSSTKSNSVTSSPATSSPSITPTSTSYLTLTTTITSTVYAAPTAVINACDTVTAGNGSWSLYYSGTGYTESSANPGNDQAEIVAPITTYLNGTFTSDCDAVKACAVGAATSPPDVYYSFDVHWVIAHEEWECTLYYDGNTDSSYFSVADAGVGNVYGFTYIG